MSKISSSQDFNDLPPRTLLTPGQTAEFLGVHRNTVYNYIDQGIIHGIKIGGAVRIKKSDLVRIFSASTEK
jgi:excisionase family DNA binding protein